MVEEFVLSKNKNKILKDFLQENKKLKISFSDIPVGTDLIIKWKNGSYMRIVKEIVDGVEKYKIISTANVKRNDTMKDGQKTMLFKEDCPTNLGHDYVSLNKVIKEF